ncbi:CAP domain-containing protein [Nioella sp.]|uniref:CAP domain-containing protein n=1 Tax=Nioella sp. TaxID=1912091 RepID=UPI003B524E6C
MRLQIVSLVAAAFMTAGCMGGTTAPSATRAVPVSAPLGSNGGVVTMMNQQRSSVGLPPVSRSQQLDRVALTHAHDQMQGGFFGHRGSNGSNVHARITAVGYNACLSAENIAMGQTSEAAVMGDWMASSGHRANILHPRAEQFGFARAGDHWVMVLARPC